MARQFRVSLLTVQRWVERARGLPLDRVDWTDRPRGPRRGPGRTSPELEDLILELRRVLRQDSELGEYGARAIHRELQEREWPYVPAVSTIHRILDRGGALDGQQRIRRRPPPRGWYLPDVAQGRAELDEFDFVEDLRLQDGPLVQVLNVVSLHGGLVGSWPCIGFNARQVLGCLIEHWRAFGRPTYAQFDNETRFQGPHQHPDAIGSVIRLCLSLDIVPVFVPVHEHGFQAAIESYNGRWQAKVWARYHHESLMALQERSGGYVAAHRRRSAARQEAAPTRRVLPEGWQLDLQARPRGRIVFLRRTDGQGRVTLLGRVFEVDNHWLSRLVRCDVALDDGVISFHALRRRTPDDQPLLARVSYELPNRRFRE